MVRVKALTFDRQGKVVPALVEVSISEGIGIHLVGIPDAQVKETLLRVVTGLDMLGFHCPGRKVVINVIWPEQHAWTATEYLDAAIAIAMRAAIDGANGAVRGYRIGMLGLDGQVKCLPLEDLRRLLNAEPYFKEGIIIPNLMAKSAPLV